MNQTIYRVWSLHPKGNKNVAPTSQEEPIVASIAQAFPDVIYFLGGEK